MQKMQFLKALNSDFKSTKFDKSMAEHSDEKQNLQLSRANTDLHNSKLAILARIVFKARFPETLYCFLT